jgi:hypothetical protein
MVRVRLLRADTTQVSADRTPPLAIARCCCVCLDAALESAHRQSEHAKAMEVQQHARTKLEWVDSQNMLTLKGIEVLGEL